MMDTAYDILKKWPINCSYWQPEDGKPNFGRRKRDGKCTGTRIINTG